MGGGGRLGDDPRAQLLGKVLASGLAPATVAEQVTAAIRDQRFWIFTHPEMQPAVEARWDAIRTGSDPVLNLSV